MLRDIAEPMVQGWERNNAWKKRVDTVTGGTALCHSWTTSCGNRSSEHDGRLFISHNEIRSVQCHKQRTRYMS